jgi:hypothetical protein
MKRHQACEIVHKYIYHPYKEKLFQHECMQTLSMGRVSTSHFFRTVQVGEWSGLFALSGSCSWPKRQLGRS